MKRFFALCFATVSLGLWATATHADVTLDDFKNDQNGGKSLSTLLNDYAPADAVNITDYKITSARTWVGKLIERLTQLGAVLAIGGIVYAGFLMATSAGDDERSKQGRTGLIWGIAGFVVMILAGPAVNAVINTFYETAGK